MFDAPVVTCDTSAPPTTPRGTRRSAPGLTTCMRARLLPDPIVGNPQIGDSTLRARMSCRHARELPAGDVQRLPMDEVRPRRAEEEDAAGRLLGRSRAPERDDVRRHAAHLLRDPELDRTTADLHR